MGYLVKKSRNSNSLKISNIVFRKTIDMTEPIPDKKLLRRLLQNQVKLKKFPKFLINVGTVSR